MLLKAAAPLEPQCLDAADRREFCAVFTLVVGETTGDMSLSADARAGCFGPKQGRLLIETAASYDTYGGFFLFHFGSTATHISHCDNLLTNMRKLGAFFLTRPLR